MLAVGHTQGNVPHVCSRIEIARALASPASAALEVGPAAGWVCDLARAMNIPVQVAAVLDEPKRFENAKQVYRPR